MWLDKKGVERGVSSSPVLATKFAGDTEASEDSQKSFILVRRSWPDGPDAPFVDEHRFDLFLTSDGNAVVWRLVGEDPETGHFFNAKFSSSDIKELEKGE